MKAYIQSTKRIYIFLLLKNYAVIVQAYFYIKIQGHVSITDWYNCSLAV